MSTQDDRINTILAEFKRLGLPPQGFGALAVSEAGMTDLLERLPRMTPPVSWRDVFPNTPAHWVEGKPETWTGRYRPLGPYDHQSLPTGPAVLVQWPGSTDPDCLDRLVDAGRAADLAIYGAGFIDVNESGRPTHGAFVILEAGTTPTSLEEFLEWLRQRSDVELAAVPRLGTEEYVV